MSDDTPILKPLTGQESNPLTSCAEDSPVSPSVLQGSEKALPMTDGSGQSLLDAFAYYDPVTSLLKTCQGYLYQERIVSWVGFPKWGLMQRGVLYQLPQSERPTYESASGLWPTPTVQMTKPDMNRQNRPNSGGDDLGSLIKKMTGGKLNPTWVEWLMGFPLGGTDLKG